MSRRYCMIYTRFIIGFVSTTTTGEDDGGMEIAATVADLLPIDVYVRTRIPRVRTYTTAVYNTHAHTVLTFITYCTGYGHVVCSASSAL